MPSEVLGGPIWVGGKNGAKGSKGTGRWVAKQIPYGRFYFEPFAGMLGVLLQRHPSELEMINDLDNTVFTFWKVVRDEPQELRRLLEATPIWSRETYYEAINLQNDRSVAPAKRAWGMVVATKWGVKKEGSQPRHTWGYLGHHPPVWTLRVEELAARLRRVYLENKPADQIVAKAAHLEEAVWYLDPPYEQAPGCYEAGDPPDLDTWLPLLASVKGRVAISGYGETWDELGWFRQTFTTTGTVGHHTTTRNTHREEVLWTNYPPASGTLF